MSITSWKMPHTFWRPFARRGPRHSPRLRGLFRIDRRVRPCALNLPRLCFRRATKPVSNVAKAPGSCYILCMEINIKIPEELAAQARARGLKLEVFVQEILARQATAPAGTSQPRTPEEIRAWLDSLAQFSDQIPPLPDIISREWIYQDHN